MSSDILFLEGDWVGQAYGVGLVRTYQIGIFYIENPKTMDFIEVEKIT